MSQQDDAAATTTTTTTTTRRVPPRRRRVVTGPAERHDDWRTRRARSEAERLVVYKELFFAGLPCRVPYDSSNNNNNNNNSHGDDDDSDEQDDVTPFPESYVRDFFGSYGRVETLVYDEQRGIGSVTFARGEDAERCYSFVHLSMLPHPHTSHTHTRRRRNTKTETTAQSMLLYLEYAQCCPFVNPTLLLLDELHAGDLSRVQLCTHPRIERKYMASTARAVVVRYVEAADEGSSNSGSQQTTTATATHASTTETLQRDGPHYPGGDVQPAVLGESLWRVLQPQRTIATPPTRGQTVTVLDLWWEYYNRYVVHKTQPSLSRVAHVYFAAASRPSVVQEVRQLERDGGAEGDCCAASSSSLLLQRFMRDDVYHGVLVYLVAVRRLRYDATWASLMRDVYTRRTVQRAQAWYASGPATQREQLQLEATLSAAVANADADAAWLQLPLLQAAANVIDNVRYLRSLSHRPRTQHDDDNDDGRCNRNTDTKTRNDDKCNSNSNNDDEDNDREALYRDVLMTIDHYAASGSASSLLSVCESPATFRDCAGHLGHTTRHRRHTTCRALLWTLSLPLSLLAVVTCVLVWLQWHNRHATRVVRHAVDL